MVTFVEQPIFRNKFQIQATFTFQKTTLVYHLKEKKIGGHSRTFSGIAHYLRCVKNSQNSVLLQRFEFQLI